MPGQAAGRFLLQGAQVCPAQLFAWHEYPCIAPGRNFQRHLVTSLPLAIFVESPEEGCHDHCRLLPGLHPSHVCRWHVRRHITCLSHGAGEEEHVPLQPVKPPHDARRRGCQELSQCRGGRAEWPCDPLAAIPGAP